MQIMVGSLSGGVNKILTVIVPSYNMEQYLPKCLGSLVVASEWMERLEILVVNDGSKDRTSEIAHEFAAKWPQTFKVIDKENGHYGSCINAALKVAHGTYVKVLDADDWFETEGFVGFLRYLLEEAEGRWGGVDLVLTDYDCYDEQGRDTGKIRQKLPVGEVFGIERLVKRPFVTFMHGYAYRTELLRTIRYRQTEGMIYTDTEWIFYPAAMAKRICYCPVVVYNYLFGREGQSVCPAVATRSTGIFVKLLFNMLELYDRVKAGVSEDGIAYMRRHLLRVSERVYCGFFLYGTVCGSCCGVVEFDRRLRIRSEEIYAEVFAGSKKLGFFIRTWRRHPFFRVFMGLGIHCWYRIKLLGHKR